MTIRIRQNEEENSIEFWDGDTFIVSWGRDVFIVNEIELNQYNKRKEYVLCGSILMQLLNAVYYQGKQAQAEKVSSVINKLINGHVL
jgi:hypothetical protein